MEADGEVDGDRGVVEAGFWFSYTKIHDSLIRLRVLLCAEIVKVTPLRYVSILRIPCDRLVEVSRA